MKISVDTNILIRAVLQDDPEQGPAAAKLLSEASLIAIPVGFHAELSRFFHREVSHL